MEQLAGIMLGFAGTTALAYYTELSSREKFLRRRVLEHAPQSTATGGIVGPNWLDGLTSFVLPLWGGLLMACSFVR
jgi:hypothetical protein